MSTATKEIQKLDIAFEQLEDALDAYFKGRFHSAIVLAGAAEQLLAGYVQKHGQTPAWLQDRKVVTKIANGLKSRSESISKPTTEKQIGDLMNHAYNHSKHAGTKDHSLIFDAKFEAEAVIDRAISNFDMLEACGGYDLPELPLAQRFRVDSDAENPFGLEAHS